MFTIIFSGGASLVIPGSPKRQQLHRRFGICPRSLGVQPNLGARKVPRRDIFLAARRLDVVLAVWHRHRPASGSRYSSERWQHFSECWQHHQDCRKRRKSIAIDRCNKDTLTHALGARVGNEIEQASETKSRSSCSVGARFVVPSSTIFCNAADSRSL